MAAHRKMDSQPIYNLETNDPVVQLQSLAVSSEDVLDHEKFPPIRSGRNTVPLINFLSI